MSLLSAIGSTVLKAGKRLISGSGDVVADRITSGLNPLASLVKLGTLTSLAAKPAVKTIATATTKAIAGVIKRPAAVIAGAAIAGVASPGLGRKATGVGAATAIGGPVAGGIVAGLIGLDYAKQAFLQVEPTAKSILTASPFKNRMPSVTEAAKFLKFSNPYDLGGLSGDEVIKRAVAAGWSEPNIVENAPTPVAGVSPEVSAGLGGLLPSGLGNVLLPAIAGTAAVATGAYLYSKRKKKKTTKRRTTKRRTTKRRTTKRRATKRTGSAKQYRRAGGKTVHYTKHGQPYIKLKSGKARFIKK